MLRDRLPIKIIGVNNRMPGNIPCSILPLRNDKSPSGWSAFCNSPNENKTPLCPSCPANKNNLFGSGTHNAILVGHFGFDKIIVPSKASSTLVDSLTWRSDKPIVPHRSQVIVNDELHGRLEERSNSSVFLFRS